MRPIKLFTIATAALALSGCTDMSGRRHGDVVTVVSQRHETRLYLKDACPVFPAPAPVRPRGAPAVVAALAPALVDGALTAFENHLKARAAALTGAHAGYSRGRLYDKDGALGFGCIVVVRGTFGELDATAAPDAKRGSLTRAHLAQLGLAAFPDLYFEAWAELEPAADGASDGVMTVTPQLLHFADTAAKQPGSGSKTVNVLLLLSRTAFDPDEGPDRENAFAVLPFQFEELEIGTELGRPAPDAASLVAHRALTTGLPPRTLEGKKSLVPFNIAAYVEETEDAGPFLKLVLEVFARKKPDLERQLTEIIGSAIQEK